MNLATAATEWRQLDPLGLGWQRRDVRGQLAEVYYSAKSNTWRARWRNVSWFFITSAETARQMVDQEIRRWGRYSS